MSNSTFHDVQGLKLEVERRGSGKPLLLLLSEEAAFERDAPFVAELACKHELIIPQAPGFGRSERPDWVSSPDDVAYMFLDLVDQLGLKNIPVVGLSLGGFIAAQMAVKNASFMSKLVMVDSLGVKIGGPFDRDVQDIWTSHPEKVAAWKWADPANGKRDFSQKSEEELTIIARNIESFARICWEPYMHDPKLKVRMHRVKVPSLFVWGEKDGVVTTDYGKAYAQLVAGSKFSVIANAGHYPHLEQPAAFLKEVNAFLG